MSTDTSRPASGTNLTNRNGKGPRQAHPRF